MTEDTSMALPLVYIAGKLERAQLFKDFRAFWQHHLTITSRWLDMTHIEMGTTHVEQMANRDPAVFAWAWCIDIRDCRASDYIIAYAEPSDSLRGGLVEVGVLLGQNKPVFLVGEDNPSFGTWHHHPQVTRIRYSGLSGLEMAARIISEWHATGPLTNTGAYP